METVFAKFDNDLYALFAFAALGALVIISSLLKDFLVAGVRMKIGKGLKNPNFGKHVKKIYEELVYLRAKADSSRMYLLQFHNGEVFEATAPRWKITQTYVSNSLGYDEPYPVFENTDVTIAWDLIGTAIGEHKSDLPEGFKELRGSNRKCQDDCVAGKGVYLCNVDKINSEQGRLKAMLQVRGIQAIVFTSVQDKKRRAFGVLCAAYCNKSWSEDIIESEFEPCQLCSSADIISNYIDGTKQSKVQFILNHFKKTS